ncbi:hypothetical protein CJ030_MR7G008261 [Morella rubra]|uniref:Uncharacterized protein n=1 Tax=Morella rubra TaxID=262757 RepID=A0A6A1V2F3_9ROSI|nr:hypothetical protein CJ030_MR7G008261 [Morella rubra]
MSRKVASTVRSILELLHRTSSCSGYISQGHRRGFPADKLGNGYGMNGSSEFQLFSTNSKTNTKLESHATNHGKSNVHRPAPDRTKLIFPHWAKWVLGSVLTLSLPWWKQDYWRKLRMIEGETELVVEEVEGIAKVVEKVAIAAEKLSAEVADKLPENGKLKEAALFVEHVSQEAAHDAEIAEQFIHKVEAIKEDLEELVNPVLAKQESKGK